MNRRLLSFASIALAAGAVGLPAGLGAEPADARLWVERATLPVPTLARPDPGGAASSVRLRIALDPELVAFDPRGADVAVEAGDTALIATSPASGAERWRQRRRVWKWSGRDAAGAVRASLDLRPGEGRLRVRAVGRDLSALAATGPAEARFALRLGDLVWIRRERLGTTGRAWHFPLTAKDVIQGVPPPPPTGLLPQGELAYETLDAGPLSGHTSPKADVIRDEPAWTAFWHVHAGKPEAPPPVDFGKDMVVVLVLSQRADPLKSPSFPTLDPPTGVGSSLSLPWVEWRPDGTCLAGATSFVDVRPYEFVRVRRSDGNPVFRRSEGTFDCKN